jgi:hypothetical protein
MAKNERLARAAERTAYEADIEERGASGGQSSHQCHLTFSFRTIHFEVVHSNPFARVFLQDQ